MLPFSFLHQARHGLLELQSCLGQPLIQAKEGDHRHCSRQAEEGQCYGHPNERAIPRQVNAPSSSANAGITKIRAHYKEIDALRQAQAGPDCEVHLLDKHLRAWEQLAVGTGNASDVDVAEHDLLFDSYHSARTFVTIVGGIAFIT